jgi:hypothetical protein
MADHKLEDIETPPLALIGVDALAFLIRNRVVFLLSALPVAGFAAIVAWLLAANPNYADLRDHWGWDFLFALIYVTFVDRWMKETLLDDASPCEEVDDLRRSIVSPRLLVIAAACYLLAMMLGVLQVQGVGQRLAILDLPHGLALLLTALVTWLPHIFTWSGLVSMVILLLPACSGVKSTSLNDALALGRPIRSKLFALVFGAALAWLMITTAANWGLELLPGKPWANAAMAAAMRFGDCVVLALAGYTLAALWRQLTDWQAPEPADRPFRDMKLRRRTAT